MVGEAGDPYQAREMIKALNPDVLTLDVEMPRMNGLVFLEKLMRLRPMPVVMVSTRTAEQSEAAIRALALGAIDCIDLKKLQTMAAAHASLPDTLLAAANAKLSLEASSRQGGAPDLPAAEAFRWNRKVVLIGSSTGGVDALSRIFAHYPPDGPPTLVAQHMPSNFIETFAARLDQRVAPEVCISRDGLDIKPGRIIFAAGGDQHLTISEDTALMARHVPDRGASLYVPAVEILFGSALVHAARIVAVMLTGMGRDGAGAMADLKDAGAHNIVQSGETAVVDGMPRAARNLGAASEVADLDNIGGRIMAATSRVGGAMS